MLLTCGARHSDVHVDMLLAIEFCRHSECRFTVTTVVTEEESANVVYNIRLRVNF